MVTRAKAKSGTSKVSKRGRATIFSEYDTREEALRAAKGLRKSRNLFAYVKKARGRKWRTLYGARKRS